jgi:hypothetical protein
MSKSIDVRPGMKQPMKNASTPCCSPKYSPNGKGGSKSEGPISKSDKDIDLGSHYK